MYKTVRQGENSLQYTILPQTEEVLTNSGVKGKGRDYSPSSHSRRLNRKLMVYYLAIVFFGLLLTFGTLLFALVLCGILPVDLPSHINTSKHEQPTAMKSSAPLSTVEPDKNSTRKKELHDQNIPYETSTSKTINLVLEKASAESSSEKPVTESDLKTTVSSTTILSSSEINLHEWKIPPMPKSPSISTTVPSSKPDDISTLKSIEKLSSPYVRQRESNVDLMTDRDLKDWTDYEDDEDDEDYDISKPLTTQSSVVKTSVESTAKLLPLDHIKTTKLPQSTVIYASVENSKQPTEKPIETGRSKIDIARNKELKERLLDDDDEEYKEPLTDEDDIGDDVKMSQAKSSWLQTRWPFVDPSSYFQWTGYSARDNLLLPAILSAALSALLVLAILCYALRRRQRCKRRIQEIGNLTSDLQAEDNAILLTAENPSEED